MLLAIEPAQWKDLKEGTGPGPITFPPLTLTEIVRYQGAAVDDHPMHHDESFAREGGYPTNFSIGLLHVATLASYATAGWDRRTCAGYAPVFSGFTGRATGLLTKVKCCHSASRAMADRSRSV